MAGADFFRVVASYNNAAAAAAAAATIAPTQRRRPSFEGTTGYRFIGTKNAWHEPRHE